MNKWPLIAPTPYEQHTPESFHHYIKTLMSSTTSREVQGVSLSVGEKLVVRMTRTPKVVTRDELAILAKEYKLDEMELLATFKKRKIGIDYANNDERITTDAAHFARIKKDANDKRKLLRENASRDKLLKLVDNSRLHEESSILTTEEPTKS
jgi:ribosomal protein S15P/S13E